VGIASKMLIKVLRMRDYVIGDKAEFLPRCNRCRIFIFDTVEEAQNYFKIVSIDDRSFYQVERVGGCCRSCSEINR